VPVWIGCLTDSNSKSGMTAIFASQRVDLRFGDFKAGAVVYDRVLDVACFDGAGTVKLIGEIKTPWVADHQIQKTLDNEVKFRRTLSE
jgi:hypothetical protein